MTGNADTAAPLVGVIPASIATRIRKARKLLDLAANDLTAGVERTDLDAMITRLSEIAAQYDGRDEA